MTELKAMLVGIVSEPLEETRWLVLADWLEEHDDPRRSELLRLHRSLLATCCDPEKHPERAEWQSRIVELIAAGVRPCVPQETLELPGGVTLTGSFIPPGSFLMGGTVDDDEKPVHKVTLTKGFFLGIYPVTQKQWKAVMGTDPSHFNGEQRPVESVSWDNARKFCKKLTTKLKGHVTVRLPTEVEWEWACRASTSTGFHFGDAISTDLANYNGNYSWNDSPKGPYRKTTTAVGSFLANAWGLFDVHGNVWEWCQDWYGPYVPGDQMDPYQNKKQSGGCRVLRGGAWGGGPDYCRAAFRNGNSPAGRNNLSGFRVCFRLD